MPPRYKQQPTLEGVRIRTAQDAMLVFYGVARGILTLLTRRLDADERKAIEPGHVYVWEDRSATTSDSGGLSMERWTDGMSWGPSRIREEFLFYYQRDPQGNERTSSANGKKTTRPMHESDKLIKQTFSVYVSLPEDHPHEITRKWHLTAYFNQRTIDSLGKVDELPNVGGLNVPENLFRSARAVKGKKEDIKRSMGQIIGPSSEQSFAQTSGSGALYTIFPSTAQSEREAPNTRRRTPAPFDHSPPPHQPPHHPIVHLSQPYPGHPRTADGAPRHYSAQPPPYPAYPHPSQSVSHGQVLPAAPGLVPLEYLESIAPPPRDPTDIHYLKQLSVSHSRGTSPAGGASHYAQSPLAMASSPPPYPHRRSA
ncbi:unnamed protein product [Peniophora sp. CBMAI 1063]|nr:unnamed protein product [Peniophora sp. CBMAI 1063]